MRVVWLGVLLGASSAAAQAPAARDPRPIFAAAALPAPGSSLPAFAFPRVAPPDAGGNPPPVTAPLAATALRGAPTVLALWSTHCPHQRPAMAALAALAREYRARGVRVVVLADDPPGPGLRAALDTLPWVPLVDAIATADGQLAAMFDRAATAPERAQYRVEFVLPSFLLLDANGQVVRRAFGAPAAPFRPALDSLLARPGASDTGAGAT